jgi:hypothetical protein
MEERDLTTEDILYLTNELNTRKVYTVLWIVILLLLCYGFYALNFKNNSSNYFKPAIFLEVVVLGMLFYITAKGIERDINLKRKLLDQKKIVGHLKVLEKDITNQNDSDSSSEYVIKVFSNIENKNKYIFLKGKDYRRINLDDLIYIEYFSDSNIIKILSFQNQKLDYIRYQIYDNK